MKKTILISILLLIALIGAKFILDSIYTPTLSEDGIYYEGIARALNSNSQYIDTPGYIMDGSDIGDFLFPGYPIFISVIYKIFGESLNNVVFIQLIFWVISSIVFYYIIFGFSNSKKFSALSTLWYLAYIQIEPFHLLILQESITISFLIFCFYYLQRYLKSYNQIDLIVLASLFSVVIAVNNRYILHLWLFLVLFVILLIKVKNIRFKNLFAPILIMLLCMAPWHIRQYSVYNKFIIISPQIMQSVGLIDDYEKVNNPNKKVNSEDLSVAKVFFSDSIKEYVYRNNKGYAVYPFDYTVNLHLERFPNTQFRKETKEQFTKKFTEQKFNSMIKEVQNYGPKERKIDYFLGFFEVYRSDFRFHYGTFSRIELPSFYDSPKSPLFWFDFADLFILGTSFIFCLVGIYFGIRQSNYFILFLAALVLNHNIIHVIAGYMPRYRITILPAVFIVAIFGAWELIKIIKQKKAPN